MTSQMECTPEKKIKKGAQSPTPTSLDTPSPQKSTKVGVEETQEYVEVEIQFPARTPEQEVQVPPTAEQMVQEGLDQRQWGRQKKRCPQKKEQTPRKSKQRQGKRSQKRTTSLNEQKKEGIACGPKQTTSHAKQQEDGEQTPKKSKEIKAKKPKQTPTKGRKRPTSEAKRKSVDAKKAMKTPKK